MRQFFFTWVCLLASIAAAGAAPEKRVALVIGQNAYSELNPLKNPSLDAETLAKTLAGRGFDVIACDGKRPGCYDLTRDGLTAAIAQLAGKAQGAALAFVFYAGHGMEAAEGNILAPTDAGIDCTTQQVARGVLVDEVLEALQGARQKIVVLDACRNNPLGEICPPATKAKLTFRQFKIPDAGNFLLVSSTKPSQVALDGLPGSHSPFARALFAALDATPNVHFDQVFSRVSKTVIEETAKANFTQIPEMLIRGGAPEACLAGQACAADPQAAALREEVEVLKHDLARDQELGETAREYLSSVEKARGKPLSDEDRRRELAALKEATRSLAARNDNRGEQALEKLRTGDTAAAERLFQEDLDAEAAQERAEAQRLAERRKKAAASARNLAALAAAKDVARAAAYYKRALELEPNDATTWNEYAGAAWSAGNTEEAKSAFAQAARIASKEVSSIGYWAANGQGDIALQQGRVTEALQYFRDAENMASRLLAKTPNSTEWRRFLAISYNREGHIRAMEGAFGLALQDFQKSLGVLKALAEEDPNNTLLQSDLAFTYNRIGAMLVSRGELDQTLEYFRASVAISERLATAEPANASRQSDLAASLGFLGIILQGRGDLGTAAESFRKQCDAWERLTRSDPGNAKMQRELSVGYMNLGSVLLKQQKLDEGEKAYSDSRSILQKIVAIDPSNTVWQSDLSIANISLGDAYSLKRNPAEALKSLREGVTILERLVKNDPSNSYFQSHLATAHRKTGEILLSQGELKGSLGALKQSESILEGLTRPDPNNAVWAGALCETQDQIAGVFAAQGDLAKAIGMYGECLATRERFAKANPGNAAWQHDPVISYRHLIPLYLQTGETGKARQLAAAGREILARLTSVSPRETVWKNEFVVFERLTTDLPALEAKAATEAAFKAGDYRRAAAAQAQAVAAKEKAEAGAKTGAAISAELTTLSWYRLFARDFEGALEASERAIAIEPSNIVHATNKAHALMFLGRAKAARALYLQYKGQPVEQGGALWENSILGDFKEFGKRGLKHRQMAEIEAALSRK
jgi:uncharacterized caspase-like protein